jgi:hypothetical protein
MALLLPDDLVLALNLSRTDLEVVSTVADRRWTFADAQERAAWRSVHAATSARPVDASESFADLELLALTLRDERVRKILRSLDDRGVMLWMMTEPNSPAEMLAESLVGIQPMPIVSEHSASTLRGWLLTAASMAPSPDPLADLWRIARQAIEPAEHEIRAYLLANLENPDSDLDAVMADLDDCRRALAWLKDGPAAEEAS